MKTTVGPAEGTGQAHLPVKGNRLTTIIAPEPTTTNPVFATLAEYAARFEIDYGGSHLRTVLLAALIASTHDVAPAEACDLARDGAFDDRVRWAGRETDRLMAEARRAWHAEGQVSRG